MEKLVDFLNNYKIYLMILVGLFIFFLIFISYQYEVKSKKNQDKIKKMVTLSIFSAISVGLYFFPMIPLNFILFFIPSFLEIHFSAVPIYLGGFLFGPISGVIIALIRFFLKIIIYTSTLGVGELSDLLIATVTVLISSIIYHKYKTKKAAIASTLTIPIFWTIIALFGNYLFILPFYETLYGKEVVFGLLSVIPGITENNYMAYYLLIGALPFNLILSVLVSLVTFFSYKGISKFYDNAILHLNNENV